MLLGGTHLLPLGTCPAARTLRLSGLFQTYFCVPGIQETLATCSVEKQLAGPGPGAPPWREQMPLRLQLRKEGGDSGDRMVSCGGSGLDFNSVSHAPVSFLQELQIPVITEQGHLSRDSRPIQGAACSILAVLSRYLNGLSAKPDPEVFSLL